MIKDLTRLNKFRKDPEWLNGFGYYEVYICYY
jgi:hypothetical protein